MIWSSLNILMLCHMTYKKNNVYICYLSSLSRAILYYLFCIIAIIIIKNVNIIYQSLFFFLIRLRTMQLHPYYKAKKQLHGTIEGFRMSCSGGTMRLIKFKSKNLRHPVHEADCTTNASRLIKYAFERADVSHDIFV